MKNVSSRGVQWRVIALVLTLGLIGTLVSFAGGRDAEAQSTIVVTTLSDTVAAGDNQCSLREAIVAANTNVSSGAGANECDAGMAGLDFVEFSVAGTVVLGSQLPAITESLGIFGGDVMTIDGNSASRIIRISTTEPVRIRDINLVNGHAASSSGGAILADAGADLTVTKVVLDNNHADGYGGAIFVELGTDLTIDSSTISNNDSDDGAGGISANSTPLTIQNSIFEANSTLASSRASAIYFAGGTALIEDTLITANTAAALNSYAVMLTGAATLIRVTIADNTGVNTSGLVASGGVELRDSTITNNDAAGGIVLSAKAVVVVNSTITGNDGRVQASSGADLELYFSTITDNTGGIKLLGDGELTLGGSIVAENHGYDIQALAGSTGVQTSLGYNLIGVLDDGGGVLDFDGPSDMFGVLDAKLGPLDDNGGATHTRAVLAGSPAIDRVSAVLAENPAQDQTGTSRPAGAKDSGAYEAVGLTPALCKGEFPTIDLSVNGGDGDGTDTDDIILGTTTDDRINGFDGDDIICAGSGDDTVRGGAGDDTIEGGPDVDDILGGGGGDTINGGGGNDIIDGQGGTDTIHGGPDDDTIDGRGAADVLNGGIGNDTINGQNGGDTINGNAGADDLAGHTGPDTFDGGSDDDDMRGGEGADTLYGGAGVDKCSGNTGPDSAEAATCETTPGVETLF